MATSERMGGGDVLQGGIQKWGGGCREEWGIGTNLTRIEGSIFVPCSLYNLRRLRIEAVTIHEDGKWRVDEEIEETN